MRTLLASLFGVILLALAAFVAREPRTEPLTVAPNQNKSQELVYDLDSDSDGLKDWEETLWGTDPKNPDTDGDGVEDGMQVESERLARVTSGESAPSTAPKRIVDYTVGRNVNEWNLAELVAQVLPLPESKLQTDPVVATYKTYGNELAEVIIAFLETNKSEVDTFQAAIKETVAPEYFDELERIAERYADAARAVASVKAPKEMAVLGKMLAESYAKQGSEVARLAGFKERGAISADSFTSYSQSVIATGRALISIAQFLSTSGVTYTSSEAGAIWALPR